MGMSTFGWERRIPFADSGAAEEAVAPEESVASDDDVTDRVPDGAVTFAAIVEVAAAEDEEVCGTAIGGYNGGGVSSVAGALEGGRFVSCLLRRRLASPFDFAAGTGACLEVEAESTGTSRNVTLLPSTANP